LICVKFVYKRYVTGKPYKAVFVLCVHNRIHTLCTCHFTQFYEVLSVQYINHLPFTISR